MFKVLTLLAAPSG